MEHPTTITNKFRPHTITAQDGLTLYVRDYAGPKNAGCTVVCLPGLTRNSADFHGLASHLATTRRVICPDYRGRGESDYDPDWHNYQPRTYIDDLRHVLSALNIHRIAIIGTSLGGILAMAMSAAMPTLLAGAVLNDIGPTIDTAGLARIRTYVKGLGPAATWDDAAATLRRCLPDWPADTDAEWRDVARSTYREMDDGSLRPNWDPAIMRPFTENKEPMAELWPLFRGLRRHPVLFVRGERSDILSQDTLNKMAAAMPHVTTLTVAGVGHAPALNTPDERAAIGRFLADVDAV